MCFFCGAWDEFAMPVKCRDDWRMPMSFTRHQLLWYLSYHVTIGCHSVQRLARILHYLTSPWTIFTADVRHLYSWTWPSYWLDAAETSECVCGQRELQGARSLVAARGPPARREEHFPVAPPHECRRHSHQSKSVIITYTAQDGRCI